LSGPAFDDLLRRLTEAGVEFVIVGGLAVNAWGVLRGTKDVDIVVAPGAANLRRLAEVAVAAGGHVQRSDALLGTPFSIAAELARGDQVAIETDLGRLDVVQGLEGVPPYEELRERATEAEVLGVSVAVCSVEDLRSMKRAAGRGQDLVDLENLDQAQG
jgi:predicted nucleotidyltransferase